MSKKRAKAKASPFGHDSRVDLLERHFAAFGTVTPANAWRFVYEELLWIDRSNGLVHLYESDKAQPGRSSWYERSITFTNRLCDLLGVNRQGLMQRIDRLFLACLERLVESRQAGKIELEAIAKAGEKAGLPAQVVDKAAEAVEPGQGENFVPYAELVVEVTELLMQRTGLGEAEAERLAREIVNRARDHLTFGSNRQNVLGEGFEDLLRLIVVRVAGVSAEKIVLRRKADKLPGFQGKLEGRTRIETPDMAIIENGVTKNISTVKWSLRQDRQKQLTDELDCYVQLCTQEFPEYVLVTNEYDPGRLKNSSSLNSRGKTVDCIYHVNPELVVEVLSDVPASADAVRHLIACGRLKSLEQFLNDLHSRFGQ
jgi:hypothetical protein